MNDKQLQDFVSYLIKEKYKVYSHKNVNKNVTIDEINTGTDFKLCPQRPLHSFKSFFLAPIKEMMEFKGNNLTLLRDPDVKSVLLGVHFYDMKALTLHAQVFKKDPYFQKKLRNMVIIGQSPIPEEDRSYQKFEKEILEHLKFDIFLEAKSVDDQKDFRIFTGSEDGQRLLDGFGYKDYENVEYEGPVAKRGMDPLHQALIEKVKKSRGSQIWKDLAKKCTACGKCAVVCPTCFCFRFVDEIQNDRILRRREWDSCFYEEFSEIAGGKKFLDTTEKRIYNYYDHKFVRIPEEYRIVGCVSCGRCTEVCPAGINIAENIKRIMEEN